MKSEEEWREEAAAKNHAARKRLPVSFLSAD